MEFVTYMADYYGIDEDEMFEMLNSEAYFEPQDDYEDDEEWY